MPVAILKSIQEDTHAYRENNPMCKDLDFHQ
jgi:hypothetical protein